MIEEVEKQPLDSKYLLAHIGSFLWRNLILWESLFELSAEIPDFKSIRNKIICAVSQEVLQTITLWPYLVCMAHHEAICTKGNRRFCCLSKLILLVQKLSRKITNIWFQNHYCGPNDLTFLNRNQYGFF
jgi:hypothetical protein